MKNNEIRKICGSLVHDTATPIATLRALFLLIQEKNHIDETKSIVEKANKEVQNIADCINHLWVQIDKRIPEEKQE